MGRIRYHFGKGKRKPAPPTWEQERDALRAKIQELEARVKTRDQELIKEYRRRQRASERVNQIQKQLRRAGPVVAAAKQGAIDIFAQVFADMMRQATDNRVAESLMQIGPHTISDLRVGGDIDEEKQSPSLWLTLPELEIRMRVDERLYPAGRLTREAVEKILGRPVRLIKGPK